MPRPLKLPKNSFVFLETLFAVVILSVLVSGFLKLTFNKEEVAYGLNKAYNDFIQKDYHNHFSSQTLSLHFTKDDASVYTFTVKKITFDNEHIKLIQYAF
jgi:hypothetical protein